VELAPTGVAISDPRTRLFDAAERVLLRDGPSALTSRAVTTEAGCAKGVLHRHFEDMDAFLVALVTDRAERIRAGAADLLARAGTGEIVDTASAVLVELFSSVAVALVGLVIARDGLRTRVRRTWPTGVPLLAEAVELLADYLAAERDHGRLPAGTDTRALALALVGSGHLLCAGRQVAAEPGELRDVVVAVLGTAGA
jgi:AcrR family transcriptional regulator